MGVLSYKVEGLDKTLAAIDAGNKKIEQALQDEINGWAKACVSEAKTRANRFKDEGHLEGAIAPKFGKLEASVTVAANYAAYVEFGTKKYAQQQLAGLPADWKTYASQFRGKGGGSMDDFIQAIMAWVRRKGIGGKTTKSGNVSTSKDSLAAMQSAAYAIALNILQNGIKAQPYLFPAYERTIKELKDNLKTLFD